MWWYQRGIASVVYKLFQKKSTGNGIKYMPNQKIANEPHKPIIRRFKKKNGLLFVSR